jgi:PEGA domain
MKKIAWVFLAGIAVLMLLFMVDSFLLKESGKTARLEVEVVPANSTVMLDGKKIKAGVVEVRPGRYKVSASREGFETSSQDVLVASGEQKYLGLALQPNSEETAGWYEDHPDDRQFSEGLSSRTYDQAGEDLLTRYPLFRELPSSEIDFTIDYGVSVKNPDDTSRYALHIKASTPALRQASIEWVRFMGYDPTDYEFYFRDLNNIFEGVE